MGTGDRAAPRSAKKRSFSELARAVVRLSRPKTLLPPAFGMVFGAAVAYGAAPAGTIHPGQTLVGTLARLLFIAAPMASLLNVASNSINQVTDITNDRINKPERPLPAGELASWEALVVSFVAWVAALWLSWLVNIECFAYVAAASVFIAAYSVPPVRLKARGFWANVAVAIPRGWLLPLSAWSVMKTTWNIEAWYIGFIYFVFLLGATTTKDFSDAEGDRAAGCETLPVKYGAQGAARIIAPFFIAPFLLMPLGIGLGIMTGNRWVLGVLSVVMIVWGAYTIVVMRRDAPYSTDENHPAWTQMYRMMVTLQAGLAVAYLI